MDPKSLSHGCEEHHRSLLSCYRLPLNYFPAPVGAERLFLQARAIACEHGALRWRTLGKDAEKHSSLKTHGANCEKTAIGYEKGMECSLKAWNGTASADACETKDFGMESKRI